MKLMSYGKLYQIQLNEVLLMRNLGKIFLQWLKEGNGVSDTRELYHFAYRDARSRIRRLRMVAGTDAAIDELSMRPFLYCAPCLCGSCPICLRRKAS
jgi:hypothetical protein